VKINLIRTLHTDEEVLDALPADEGRPLRTEAIETVWGLFEVLLKAPARLDAFLREPALVGKLLAGFTVLVAAGYGLYGLALGLLLLAGPRAGVPELLGPLWSGDWRSAAALAATYPAGLLAATLLCWPSYWYFAQLGGARLSPAQTLAHSLKGKAAAAVLLLGLLPIYAIGSLGLITAGAPAGVLQAAGYAGLLLPFVGGLRGAVSIYNGFEAVVRAMPARVQRQRYMLPSWLVLMWAALFTLAAPLTLYTVWGWLARL
jgi:hypothetical protein